MTSAILGDMKVGLAYDPIYLNHDTGGHVENASRLREVMSHLEEKGVLQRVVSLPPRPATTMELARVHTNEHIAHIEATARTGGGWLDSDTVMSGASYEVGLYAAGGALVAVESVLRGGTESAFALVRPPGHHATSRRAMGFCLFNNIAIAARYALDHGSIGRILVVDFDVHHGNGTQDAFYDDPGVLYFSVHQSPLYPGTGGIAETGAGEGTGANINVPLPPGCGDGEYGRAFEEVLAPAARRFQPELILVSAGYDAHWSEALALMKMTVSGFARMVSTLKRLAKEMSSGHLVLCLEGGYNLPALAASVRASLEVLLEDGETDDPLGKPPPDESPDVSEVLRQTKETHRL
ncbi:MAG: histone deacetylase [Dehalococcoidia bacterium]|nr:histone deacetylase [Dehalococcoidia bacterium]